MLRGRRLAVERVTAQSPHGIYIYDPDVNKWVLISRDGGSLPFNRDGVYVLYFDNTRCPACRAYDIFWYAYHALIGSRLRDTYFAIILCEWFTHKCNSEAARKAFSEYKVKASPTTLFLVVKNRRIIVEERKEGVLRMDELADLVDAYRSRLGEEPEEEGEKVG